jgi:hypothetical protein
MSSPPAPPLPAYSALQAGGRADLDRGLAEYAGRGGAGGLLILISDLLDPDGVRHGLQALGARGHEITVLHVLGREELSPTLLGDLELVDSESSDRQPMTLDAAALAAYERRLDSWLVGLRQDCGAVSAAYCLVEAETPTEETLFGLLRRARVLVS